MKSLLHRHSTLFGLGGALVVTLLAGLTTRWNVVVMLVVGLAAAWYLPRLAYGRAESERIDTDRSPFVRFHYSTKTGERDSIAEMYRDLPGGFDTMGRPVDMETIRKSAEEEEA